jgi:hypothetical protein
MGKTIKIKDGLLHLIESKAKCPICGRVITFSEIEPKIMKSTDGHIKIKCCNSFIGITSNIEGDFTSY